MNVPQKLYLMTVSLVLASMTIATLASAGAGDPPADPAGASATLPGQATYDKMCKSCHAADGRGNAQKATTLKIDAAKLDLAREEVKDLPRDEKRRILLEGKEKMPAYAKKLKPEEVDAVLDYALKLAEKR